MNSNEEKENGDLTSKAVLFVQNDNMKSANSQMVQERPDSPESSSGFMKRKRSNTLPIKEFLYRFHLRNKKQHPPEYLSLRRETSQSQYFMSMDGDSPHQLIDSGDKRHSFKSSVSMRTERSKNHPLEFCDGRTLNQKRHGVSLDDLPTCESLKSGQSKHHSIEFKPGGDTTGEIDSGDKRHSFNSWLSMWTDMSKGEPINFSYGGTSNQESFPQASVGSDQRRSSISGDQHENKTHLDSIFMLLEKDIYTLVKNELKRLKNILYPGSSETLEDIKEETAGEEENKNNRDALLRIVLDLLKKRKQNELAEALQNKTRAMVPQQKLKSNLMRKFQCMREGQTQARSPTMMNQIYTELRITDHGQRDISDQPIEATSLETSISCEDLFKPRREGPVRTLMTKGASGIGKTVLTQKYILDWAEDKTNSDIQFIFPFTFRELNLVKDKNYSLVELIHHFFSEIKEAGICRFEEFQVLFIFDGLDECRPPLDFHKTQILTDVTESTSVYGLIINLIRGDLLPSARLWITTRPAAANQIPPQYVDKVTEVTGFSDSKKEEYFMKRFREEELAQKIISHTETSRSFHVMCDVPIFCWITATVLDHVLRVKDNTDLPKTLTELYIHFLEVQVKQDTVKYDNKYRSDSIWTPETKKIICSLGKLAFDQLEEGNLMFSEEELENYGRDINNTLIYSGLVSEIYNDECGFNQDRVFGFVHLSIQEFLAALYVFLIFMKHDVNLIRRKRNTMVQKETKFHRRKRITVVRKEAPFQQFFQGAVDRALESPNGHQDMFVRFLLGLSLKTNQTLLKGLTKNLGNQPQVKDQLVQYIQNKIRVCKSVEKNIRMFHWLNELNDHSLEEEIQHYLKDNTFDKKLTPTQWSALVFILLSSQKDLDTFDLKKFSASKEALLWLQPVIKSSKKSLLSSCNLLPRSCITLVPILTSESSCLRELDLSNNDLQDSGVALLSQGLGNPKCRLEVLSLSGCKVTEEGCASLAKALSFNPSHLRELDLSFNHPGESGEKLLSDGLDDPNWRLETLKKDHCGKLTLNPSPQRFFCELTLDPNTADRNLVLSEHYKRVVVVKDKQPYPDHPDRFNSWRQLLCSDGFTGRCYWEVRWKGSVRVGVTYKGIRMRGRDECYIGGNDHSWSLSCTSQGFKGWHNNKPVNIETAQTTDSGRIAVYLDWKAGTVSFYSLPQTVSSIKKIHLHTFQASFTEPLYPAFGFGQTFDFEKDSALLSSSVTLLQVE